jgi:predicted nuclease of predicted toxin-antitoxin system
MKKYLVDVNLPKFFIFFDAPEFIHVRDINPKMTDSEIWNYAFKNQLVILSKDIDFYKRFLISNENAK